MTSSMKVFRRAWTKPADSPKTHHLSTKEQ
jgi:hypothetical protein